MTKGLKLKQEIWEESILKILHERGGMSELQVLSEKMLQLEAFSIEQDTLDQEVFNAQVFVAALELKKRGYIILSSLSRDDSNGKLTRTHQLQLSDKLQKAFVHFVKNNYLSRQF